VISATGEWLRETSKAKGTGPKRAGDGSAAALELQRVGKGSRLKMPQQERGEFGKVQRTRYTREKWFISHTLEAKSNITP